MPSARAPICSAVVTGAAHGIGAAFSRRLAAEGVALWLTDRDAAGLADLATQLRAGGAAVETLTADLCEADGQEAVAAMVAAVPALDLLINNAGYGRMTHFLELDPQEPSRMLQLLTAAPVRLCRAALPGMARRRSGAIINVCSLVQHVVLPGGTIYGPAKLFLHQFTRQLAADMEGSGIKIQALVPGYTRTRFHHTEAYIGSEAHGLPGFLWSTPEQVVAASLKGLRSPRVTCVPGLLNRYIAFWMNRGLFPNRLLRDWVA